MVARAAPLFSRTDQHYVAGHRVSLLRNGREAFPAMLAAIDGARRQVLLEMYWFDSGRIGRRVALALSAAARRGVEVALLYDSLGSVEADGEMFESLRAAGVRVLEFNPIAPWRERFNLAKLSRRDHRKILVVDGNAGFTGGINVSDLWLPEDEGGQGWRDDMVRVEGPVVADFVKMFRRTWRREGGRRLQALSPPPKDIPMAGAQSVRVLGEAYARHRREIVRAYLFHIYNAKRRVWIANSYFVPDGVVLRALIRAARRGVDVRVLVPGRSDVLVVQIASRAMYEKLLTAGVRLFEWQGNVLHSKTAVIDSDWSTIGTFNLDYRSLRVNLEVNVSILDARFAAVMEQSYLSDLENSVEVAPREKSLATLPGRLVENTLYRFRKLL